MDVASLPDDPAALKAVIAALAGERDQVSHQRDQWHVKFLRAEAELLKLKKLY